MTREDVLKEFTRELTRRQWEQTRQQNMYAQGDSYTYRDTVAMADEIMKLRAQLAGVREKIHALDCWDIVGNCDGDSGMCTTDIERVSNGQYLDRDDVLAALGEP